VSELLRAPPAPFLLHSCAHPGCRRLAFGVRCDEHMTDADRAALHAFCVAVIAAADAEERWREARRRVREAEAAAGVHRSHAIAG
jgi:phage terminase small subunit